MPDGWIPVFGGQLRAGYNPPQNLTCSICSGDHDEYHCPVEPDQAVQLCHFIGDRVQEDVDQINDPKLKLRAWKEWRRHTRDIVDWADVGHFGAPRYIPALVKNMDALQALADRWSDHPDYPAEETVK